MRGDFYFAFFIDSGYRHGEINVVRFPSIAVKPWSVEPPGVVRVESEKVTFVGKFAHAGHVSRHFQSKIPVQSGPGRVWRRQNVLVLVYRFQVNPVTRQVGSCGKVGSSSLDLDGWAFGSEIFPEVGDLGFGGAEFGLIKVFSVQNGPRR